MTAAFIRVVDRLRRTCARPCRFRACEKGNARERRPLNASKPLKLENHRRKPVATSATRTVKQSNGEYAKVAVKRRAKTRVPQ